MATAARSFLKGCSCEPASPCAAFLFAASGAGEMGAGRESVETGGGGGLRPVDEALGAAADLGRRGGVLTSNGGA